MRRPVLFLAGPHASGKTELATHLVETYGHSFVDLGPSIRAAHRLTGFGLSFGDWVSEGEKEHGPDFTNAVVAQAVKNSLAASKDGEPFVVSGSRSYPGLRYLIEAIEAENHRTMYVDAPEDDMYHRYKERENRPDMSTDEFSAILERDKVMGLEGIKNRADWVVYNCGTLATFYTVATNHLSGWIEM